MTTRSISMQFISILVNQQIMISYSSTLSVLCYKIEDIDLSIPVVTGSCAESGVQQQAVVPSRHVCCHGITTTLAGYSLGTLAYVETLVLGSNVYIDTIITCICSSFTLQVKMRHFLSKMMKFLFYVMKGLSFCL